MSGVKKLIDTTWEICYKNWRGITAIRKITIKDFEIGSNKYHKDTQLLMKTYDHDRKDIRFYATKDIIEWMEKIE